MQSVNSKIVQGLKMDDPSAMKMLFDLYYTALCNYAKRYTNDPVAAEEVVSDVMFKFWQNRTNSYQADMLRDYLFAATRNTSLNYLKQQQNRYSLLENWAEKLRNELIAETPLDKLLEAEMQTCFDTIINSLPEQTHTVFLLSREKNLTYKEIADRLCITENTVKYHIKVALKKLRSGLG